jgi:hypothetical protein
MNPGTETHEMAENHPTPKDETEATAYYPWGAISDFVHDPDLSGRKFFTGVSGADNKSGRFERLAISGFLFAMLIFLAIVAMIVS